MCTEQGIGRLSFPHFTFRSLQVLVLSGDAGDKFMIGDNIVVTIVSVVGGRVRLGFDAPRKVPVHREKIFRELADSGQTHLSKHAA